MVIPLFPKCSHHTSFFCCSCRIFFSNCSCHISLFNCSCCISLFQLFMPHFSFQLFMLHFSFQLFMLHFSLQLFMLCFSFILSHLNLTHPTFQFAPARQKGSHSFYSRGFRSATSLYSSPSHKYTVRHNIYMHTSIYTYIQCEIKTIKPDYLNYFNMCTPEQLYIYVVVHMTT